MPVAMGCHEEYAAGARAGAVVPIDAIDPVVAHAAPFHSLPRRLCSQRG